MPDPSPIIRILPAILKLFPAIRSLPIVRGVAIPINNVNELTETETDRALAEKIRVPRRRDTTKDSSQVLKLDAAIHAVEETFNETTLIKEFVLSAAKQLIGGVTTEGTGQKMAEKLIEKLREAALRQDTPRTTGPTRQKYHRPATGHGEGRQNF